jgi:recombinational DNA repair ATPase RecF
MQYRFRYVDFVLSHIHIVQHLLPQYVLQFVYTTSLPRTDIAGYVQDYLLKNRQRDILVGHTSIGPHRDDYVCTVDTSVQSISVRTAQGVGSRNEISSEDIPAEYIPVAEYLSRGENKTILLGLKHIEILFLEKTVGKPLILLFDDIFSELDQTHSIGVLDMFDTYQYIITAQSLPLYIQNTHKITCINIDSEYSI